MTREIALHCMKSASELERELCEECPIYGQTGCDHCYEDALQYVIGMLEQEPILDRVREEIKVMTSNRGFLSCSVEYIHKGIDNAFDKYKAETEAKDGNDK